MRDLINNIMHHVGIDADAIRQFCDQEDGATVIEYGLIVSLIFLAIIAGVQQFSDTTSNMYSEITSAMAAANN